MLFPPIFVDSGAHGLYNEHVRNTESHTYAWYDTQEFTDYLDRYATFIKAHKDNFAVYANVDVIFDPQKTWDAQMYLEEVHGLSPLPVIHHATPLVWLEKYIKKGYDYIGLGGMAQDKPRGDYIAWADQAFTALCDPKTHLPFIKVHGFAVTAHSLMLRYPWWSVDSTTWQKLGGYGMLLIPPRRKGVWRYDLQPLLVPVSQRTRKNKREIPLGLSYKSRIQSVLLQYIEEKGFTLGETRYDEETQTEVIVSPGLSNDGEMRARLNMVYFIDLAANQPPWPWPFNPQQRRKLL